MRATAKCPGCGRVIVREDAERPQTGGTLAHQHPTCAWFESVVAEVLGPVDGKKHRRDVELRDPETGAKLPGTRGEA